MKIGARNTTSEQTTHIPGREKQEKAKKKERRKKEGIEEILQVKLRIALPSSLFFVSHSFDYFLNVI